MDFEYKASVIVPVYNVEKYLRKCLDSLAEQTVDKNQLEILVINDGSTDGSWDICVEYSQKYDFIKAFTKENEGLSATRNFGIINAKGKYIFFLDSDDYFTPQTVEKVTDFFDTVYDEVDMVAYNEVRFSGNETLKPHFRFKILDHEGVYNLNEYPYITQTRVNICVKNMDDYNILFNTTPGFRLEDQEYCNRVLMPKMKLGYCPDGTYMYNKGNESSIMNVYFHAYYLFQTSMEYFEGLFETFEDKVPEYFQSIFINDLRWRLKDDILLPYQYEGKAYADSVGRISSLLKRVDDRIILEHPDCAEMNKQYFLALKYDGRLDFENGDRLCLKNGEKTVYETDEINLVIDKLKFRGDMLEICGHLSSPVLLYVPKPEFLLRRKRGAEEPVELFESSFCCDSACVKNNQAWGFRLEIDTSKNTTFGFVLKTDGKIRETKIVSGEWVAVKKEIGREAVVIGTKECRFTEKRIIVQNVGKKDEFRYKLKEAFGYLKKNRKVFAVRILNLLMTLVFPKRKVWLYSDDNTNEKGNAYLQFVHDCQLGDSVRRYYVIDGNIEEKSKWFDESLQEYLIPFRSNKHKLYYLMADKVIVSSTDSIYYLPFFDDIYKFYMDLFKGEVICLGNGVFNAHLPWQYAYDRLDLGRRVVSTDFEFKTLTEKYGYPAESLIKSKMPCYDFLENREAENRILFAPSWRRYLIGQKGSGSWIPAENRFTESDYFRDTMKFLLSPELENLLSENDLYLDFKLHPVYSCYKDCFVFSSSRINVVEEADYGDYSMLITDYSAAAFDFVYLNRPVLYFVPDYDKFKAGMHSFRQLEMPLEDGFGELTTTPEKAVEALGRIIENDGNILPPFAEKYSDFFFKNEKDCMERIYNAVIN